MIQLLFRDNGKGYEDIIFRFYEFEQICDSYYFFIDSNYSNEANLEKFVQVFNRLIMQWIKNIESLRENNVIYLPFDFSDQYTGCIRVTKQDNYLQITPGWSYIEGWKVYPSDISNYVKNVNDFEKSYSTKILQVNEILNQLEECLLKGE